MTKVAVFLTLLGAVLVGLLPAVPAQAQSIRTFVSTAGSDSNPCSITQPCRHFQAAVNATATGGEVDALDPGAYGSFTISHAIGIEGQGWSYVAPPANGAAIAINAVGSSDKISIHGVFLNGVGTAGATGIQFNSGGTLTVQDCVLRNFADDGIHFAPSASSQLLMSNVLISDNTGSGITIEPSGSGTTVVVLDHVKMISNHAEGLNVFSGTQNAVDVTVSDSVSAGNHDGISTVAQGASASITVRNSTIINNSDAGLLASSSGAEIWITRSTITANVTGLLAEPGGAVMTFGDNDIFGNTSAGSTPTATAHK